MTTAEQIIAEHRMVRSLRFNGYVCEGDCGWEIRDVMVAHTEIIRRARDAHAAHVVAALTNAGHVIVDDAGIYVEYGIERDMPSGGVRVVAAYDRSTAERVMAERPHDTRLVQRRGHIGEWEPAAARVAEGGEHRG